MNVRELIGHLSRLDPEMLVVEKRDGYVPSFESMDGVVWDWRIQQVVEMEPVTGKTPYYREYHGQPGKDPIEALVL